LMPKTFVSDASNLDIPAWYAVTSLVQPPVNAAGKNASTTLDLPLKSESVTLPPVATGKVKSGAVSPTFREVLGGGVAWANRLMATSAPVRTRDSFLMKILQLYLSVPLSTLMAQLRPSSLQTL